ncbi:BamA/TamA family outer membrane protein [Synechococcus sp. H60.3]
MGAGIRIQSPLGPLRIDYAIGQGEAGQAQLHFGIGEKF